MTTLAVLAGGQGRRMGGPKDLLVAEGRPVLVELLERIAWPGPTLLVAPFGDRLPTGHEGFERTVRDAEPGHGPLRGILTALCGAETDSVVCIPVDMPGLRREHLKWVVAQLNRTSAMAGLLLSRRKEGATIIEPFPSGFRRTAAEAIRLRLEVGRRAVHHLGEERGFETIAAPESWPDSIWLNVNLPSDLPSGWERASPRS